MIALIRHGMTAGNKLGRYIGTTDESLCGTDGLDRVYPKAEMVVTSPMKRCIETAEYIYPDTRRITVEDLRECDFGRFENKSYEDLKHNRAYMKWLESMGKLPFPGGEAHGEFKARCVRAFEKTVRENSGVDIAFVIHGGTIMAIMQSRFGGGFYDYRVENGGGFTFELEGSGEDDYLPISGA